MKTYSTKTILKHLGLFLLTLLTTTLAGAEWLYGKTILSREGEHALTVAYFLKALHFSVPFLFILLVHELGHLLTALHHKVKSSLPFFIPGWLGFLGALTRDLWSHYSDERLYPEPQAVF
ncbi:zinc metalloprotease [Nitritalea halalkaliphila]|uniref:hypothetical protein n=1 Tax=Nitritalea halalkaliphila TaxID=590849 RepID=UPI0002E93E21|nr:hypothetical protein [Nitritalea halalkaliphila]